MKFPAWPEFTEAQIAAASNILHSGKVNYWTGSEGKDFERDYAAYAGVDYAVAVSNGTVALEIALRAAGVKANDEVIVAPRTFVATAHAPLLINATPVFCDVDRSSGNISAETIAAALTPKTKAIICVHLGGLPCDMDPIMELAERRGLIVIEDCAQAHGAKYKARHVGSIGHIAALSFCQDKIITTGGEGGMILTSNKSFWQTAWSYKDHGKHFDTVFNKRHLPGFRWLHEAVGTNARMTEMQSAIGRVALKQLPQWVEKRRHNAAILDSRFASHETFEVLHPLNAFYHSYYKYYVNVRPNRLKEQWNRDRIMHEISQHKVPCFSGSCCEVYREKVYADLGLQPLRRFPNARFLSENALMFPVHPTLGEKHMHRIADVVGQVVKVAKK